jgi:AraC-like DNA-binding protein
LLSTPAIGLANDLFTWKGASLRSDEYFRLWRGMEEESSDSTLPIPIGEAISVEVFNPPIFVALCSPDLNAAFRKINRYKRLMCPMALHIDEREEGTTLEFEWLHSTIDPPGSLVAMELVLFVQLARIATRTEIRPIKVTTTNPPEPSDAYTEYFGVEIQKGSAHRIMFSAQDAKRPFLTANDRMWKFFEPELRKRLSELDENATISERVRGALLELLPSGNASIEAVSRKLQLSARTLQRRLNAEGEKYQVVLNKTRENLALHYLGNSTMSEAEISFLLGYEDPNSFFRAFHSWTGTTPEQARTSVKAAV